MSINTQQQFVEECLWWQPGFPIHAGELVSHPVVKPNTLRLGLFLSRDGGSVTAQLNIEKPHLPEPCFCSTMTKVLLQAQRQTEMWSPRQLLCLIFGPCSCQRS